ncbi:MAG TPA: hypothetical protein O0X70_00760 [Methanocorpusculum sp.]|nr:hypothetical protein [Methanocorpusculum sp.]
MKKILYTVLAVFLVAALCTGIAGAVEKEEVAYVNLENDGSVEQVLVVNIFELDAGQSFTDYGNYRSVRNMVTSDPVTINGDEVTGTVSNAVKLFYEGDLGQARLPWDISIKYYLNGEEISADELGGKSGYLAIYIDIVQNPYLDKYFYKNYALQITASLDANKCMDISADGATIANVGANKQLTFTQMPNKETHIVISSNVVDFSMAALTINGVRLSMDFDVDIEDTKKDMQDLEDGIVKLDDGVAELQEGIEKLKSGQVQIESGANTLASGAYTLSSSLSQIASVVDSIDSILRPIVEDLPEGELKTKALTLMNKIKSSVDSLASGSQTLYYGARNLASNEAKITSGIESLAAGIEELKDGTTELRDKTAGMSDQLTDKIDEILDPLRGKGGAIPSYVSSKNQEIKSVQFAMHTKEIKEPEAEKEPEEPEEDLNFFQRILKLFGA